MAYLGVIVEGGAVRRREVRVSELLKALASVVHIDGAGKGAAALGQWRQLMRGKRT